MNPLRLALQHLRVTAMYEVQYRANFFVQIVHSVLGLVTGLVAISLVFNHTSDLAGWSRAELLIVLGIHVAIGALVRTFIFPNMEQLMRDIAEGDFDFVLVRPVDAQLLVSIRRLRVWNLVDVVVGGVVVVWGARQLADPVSALAAVAFIVAVAAGAVIMYCLWVVVTATAFKVVRVEEITQLLNGVYDAARWPVSVYPAWLRNGLTFVIPLAFAVTVPAEALSGRLNGAGLAIAVVVTVVALVVTRVVWLVGVRQYSGASA